MTMRYRELMGYLAEPLPSERLRVIPIDELEPDIKTMVGCTQNQWHKYDVWEHTLRTVDACPQDDPILRLAAFFHDIAKPLCKGVHPETGDATFYDHDIVGAEMTLEILIGWGAPKKVYEPTMHMVRHHYIRYRPEHSDASVQRWVRKVGQEYVKRLCLLAKADIIAKDESSRDFADIEDLERRIIALQQPKQHVKPTPLVTGEDVMTILGIGPGPTVGRVLAELYKLTLSNPPIIDRDVLLQQVPQIAEKITTK